MTIIRTLTLLLTFLVISAFVVDVKAQADTTFWFAAPAITPGHAHLPILLRFATYSQSAIITISEPANPNFIPYTISLAANSATYVDLTSQIDIIENKPTNTVLNYGLKIVSSATISAYYEEEGQVPAGTFNNPEIFPLKGRYAEGKSFVIPSQTIFDNKEGLNPLPNNGFVIVATQDNTTVTVTLSDSDAIGHLPGIPFKINLNKGQSYSVTSIGILASEHLGGSSVKSDKPICITIFDDSIVLGSHYDLAGDQIVAEEFAGNEFIMVRGDLNNPPDNKSDYYFIWGITDSTVVNINGNKVATINRGQEYKGILSASSLYITTSNPAYVLQFTGTAQEVTETSIPGIKCTGSQIVSFVRSTDEYFQLDVLCKASQINSFLVNGVSGIIKGSLFSVVPNTQGVWEYARINSTNLPNIDDIFLPGVAASVTNSTGLFHLGFLNGGTSTGSRLGYFSSYGIGNFAPSPSTNVCINNDIQLQANLISGTTYSWAGPQGFTSNVYDPVIVNAQPANSGLYIVTATVPGCGIFNDTLSIVIYPPLTGSFVRTNDTTCAGVPKKVSVSLIGKAPWTLAYTDGTKTDTIYNITKSPYTFSVAPKKNTVYSFAYLNDATFCYTGAITINPSMYDTIVVNPLPTINFTASDSLCIGNTEIISLNITGKSPWNVVFNDGKDTLSDTVKNIPLFVPVSPKVSTVYSVTSLKDSNGCSAVVPINYKVQVFDKPKTAFTTPNEICLRDTAFFKDNSKDSSLKIVKWHWNFGNNTTDTLKNDSTLYSIANTYNVSLYTVNNAGCISDTLTKSIIVNPLPIAAFSHSSLPLCETRIIPFKDKSNPLVGNITRWHWDMGDSRIVDTTNNDTVTNTYSKYGQYKVRLMVETNKGCLSDTVSQIIKINALPIVGFVVPEICLQDAAATFKDTSTIGDNTAGQFVYKWSFDASTATPVVPLNNYPTPTSSNQKNPTIKYNQVGQYFVSDTVTSINGCKAFKTSTFEVNGSNPVASFSIKKPNQLCSNDSVMITNTSTVDFGNLTKLEIYWDFANNPTEKEVIINPVLNGSYGHLYPPYQNNTGATKTYSIHIAVYSGGICGNESTNSISLLPSPKTTFLPVAPICNNISTIALSNYTSESSGISDTISYIGQNVDSNGIFFPPIAPLGTTHVIYQAKATNGCIDTSGRDILVLGSPTITQGFNQYLLAGTSTELSPLSNSDSVNYKWTPTTYLTHANDSTAIVQIPVNAVEDSILYTLTVTNEGNVCNASGSVVVYLLHQPKAPNTFSPNGDGINDFWVIDKLADYPNPLVQVFDRNGQLVFQREGQYTPWDGTYQGMPVPVGTYYYVINPRNGQPSFSGSVTIIR